jgi:competence protein ComEA
MSFLLRVLVAALLLALAGVASAVDANHGNRAQLEQLRGIGPPLADAILVERERGGAFKDWADLMARVKGIRDARAAKLSEAGLRVAGAPYLAPTTPSSSISK